MKRSNLLLFVILIMCFVCAGTTVSAHTCNANEWETLKLTNKERMKQGLEPLTSTDKLQKACDIRAKELTTYFSHTRPNGSSCFSVLSPLNITYYSAGENIAMGYFSASSVVNGWMNSPGHKANILGSYSHMGVGYTKSGYNWVQLFVGGCSSDSISVSGTKNLTITKGKSLESLDLTVTKKCDLHGTSYMPLIKEMTKGYNANKVGKQTVTVTAGKLKTTFTITVTNPTTKKLSKAKISAVKAQTYTGKAIKPNVKVTYGSSTLKAGKDYTISYKDNKKVGTATITIKGKGNYTGTIKKTFKINARSVAKLTYSKVSKKAYTGKAIKPNVTVKYGSTKLIKNKDYTISYKNNKKPGIATITIKGKGNFKGTKTITFKIYKK